MSRFNMQSYVLAVAAGEERTINAPGGFLFCYDSSGGIDSDGIFKIKVDDGPWSLWSKGLGVRLPLAKDALSFFDVRIWNDSANALAVTLYVADGEIWDSRNVTVGSTINAGLPLTDDGGSIVEIDDSFFFHNGGSGVVDTQTIVSAVANTGGVRVRSASLNLEDTGEWYLQADTDRIWWIDPMANSAGVTPSLNWTLPYPIHIPAGVALKSNLQDGRLDMIYEVL